MGGQIGPGEVRNESNAGVLIPVRHPIASPGLLASWACGVPRREDLISKSGLERLGDQRWALQSSIRFTALPLSSDGHVTEPVLFERDLE